MGILKCGLQMSVMWSALLIHNPEEMDVYGDLSAKITQS